MKKRLLLSFTIFLPIFYATFVSAEDINSVNAAAGRAVSTTHLEKRINAINFATANVGEAPSKYKKRIKKAIRMALDNPDSAEFSNFTTPRKEVLADRGKLIYGYAACVTVDHPIASDESTGSVRYWVFMRDNQILRIKNTQNPGGTVIFPGRKINCD